MRRHLRRLSALVSKSLHEFCVCARIGNIFEDSSLLNLTNGDVDTSAERGRWRGFSKSDRIMSMYCPRATQRLFQFCFF
jgi:hypothetical protein